MKVPVADESDARRPAPGPAADATATALWERVRLSIAGLSGASQRQREPEFVARRLAERAKTYREALQPDRRNDSVLFLGFSTARERYAIAVDEVLEIEPLEHCCLVPQAPPFLRGLIQWRGTILTLLDLGQLFSIPRTGLADLQAAVIIEAAGKRIAVAAGQIEGILTIATDQIMAPPALPGDIPETWLVGVYDSNRMLLRMSEILSDEGRLSLREGNRR